MNEFCVLSFYNAFSFAECQGKMAVELKSENKFISELYLQSEVADVHFSLKTGTDDEIVNVPAHTLILAATSPVFKAMFFGKVKKKDVVKIATTNSSAFEEFLQIFYLPVLTITMENVDEVTCLADRYQVMDRLKVGLTVKDGNQNTFTSRQVPSIQWNNNAVLTCKLEQDKYCVSMKNTESTWFSSDHSVLLGIIGIGGGCINKANIVLAMSIVECNQQSFPLTADSKVLYETIVEFSSDAPHILLPQPVIVRPLKMYEIRFEGTNNLNYYHLPISKTKRRLDGDIVIKFYENPNDEQSELRGLVSSLSFNRF